MAYNIKTGEISDNYAHCDTFAVYEYENDTDSLVKTLADCSAVEGNRQMSEMLKELNVDLVMCGNMGAEAKAMLLSNAIVPIVGFRGDADTAAKLLAAGNLPIAENGSCTGQCGTCGGSCGSNGCSLE